MPFSPDDYIHRGGRTARAGAVGEVMTFVAPEEEDDLQAIEKAIGLTLPRVILPNFDHGAHEHVPRPVIEDGRGRRGGRGGRSRQGGSRRGARPHGSAADPAPAAPAEASPAATTTAAGDGAAPAPAKRRRRRRRRPTAASAPTE